MDGSATERPVIRPVGMPDLLKIWRRDRLIHVIDPVYLRLLSPQMLMRERGLTQRMMALMLGVHDQHYGELERRGGRGFSRTLVGGVARILGLDADQEYALYRWAQLRPPAGPHHREIGESLLRRVREQSHPALLLDDAFDVLAHNEIAAYHLPWISAPRANVLTWALGDPAAPATLLDWEASWGRPMLAMCRMAVATHPGNVRLQQVLAAVLRNPRTQRLWEASGDMRAHDAGDIRPILLPTLAPGPTRVEMESFVPAGRPDLRMVVTGPADPEQWFGTPLSAIQAAERLAHALLTATGAALVTVNDSLGLGEFAAPVPGHGVDVGLRRAAIAAAPGRGIPDGFLRPGDPLPVLPDQPAIRTHLRGEALWLRSYDAIAEALGNTPELVRRLIPGPRVRSLIHCPLTAGRLVLGSVEAWQFDDSERFTSEHVDLLRRMASVRAAAMLEDAAARRRPATPPPARGDWAA